MFLWLSIAVRIIANPCSNALQKLLAQRGVTPLMVIGVTHLLLSFAVLPGLFWLPLPTGLDFWSSIIFCAALAVVGNVLIVQAVQQSDLSLLGPINSYKPVVSLLPGMLLLGETPGWAGLSGIALIVAGSYLLVDHRAAESGRPALLRLFSDRGVQLRVAALVVSAVEAVFLKRALLLSSPLTAFIWWAVLGLGVSLAAKFVVGRTRHLAIQVGRLREQKWLVLGLALTTGLMQFTSLVAFAYMQVGYALALFQTSTLISVFLGRAVFQEPHFKRRLAGSAVMVVGAVVIVLNR